MDITQIEPTRIVRNAIPPKSGTIKRFQIVELGGAGGIANGTTGRVNFLDQAQLRNQPGQIVIITNIEIFMDSVYSHSQVTNSIVGFPAADLPKAVLNLYVQNEETIFYLPLAKLNHVDDGLSPFQWDLQGFDRLPDVAWDKSFVQFSAATAGGPYVIPFGVTYYRFKFDPAAMDSSGQVGCWMEK